LIEMSKRGVCFVARNDEGYEYNETEMRDYAEWLVEMICRDWEYKIKNKNLEPLTLTVNWKEQKISGLDTVIYPELHFPSIPDYEKIKGLVGKKTKITIEEI